MNLAAIDKWHKTTVGRLAFGLAELILAYVIASLALNSGSLWEYAVAFILAFGGARNLIRMFTTHNYERHRR